MKINLKLSLSCLVGLICLNTSAQETSTAKASDSIKKATKELPLEPSRSIAFTTDKGTWTSLDVSPDGQTIVFDLMGDLYTMPISGGNATAITHGLAYEVHPRFSPDGKSLAYISDKSGSDNIWLMDLSSKEDTQISKEQKNNFFSVAWSPDGDYLVGAKGRRNIKLHLYHKDGGGGAPLISEPKGLKAIDPFFGADGKTLYFSQRNGAWNYNAQLPQYQVGTYSMEDGATDVITSRYGSAFTPTLSKDGKWLVYGTRFEDQTGLILRDLNTGEESWLAYPVQRDEQESIAPLGVLPAMSFTPDSNALIVSYGGDIHRITLSDKTASKIPYTASVALELGPQLDFKYPISDADTAMASQIRDAKPSPDGKRLAFTALNRLYVMDLPNGTPKRVTTHDFTEAQPAWSPDGSQIVFTTWNGSEGHLYKARMGRRTAVVKLTQTAGIYTQPRWSYAQDRIVFLAGSNQVYKDAIGPMASNATEDLMWISGQGGSNQFIAKSKGREMPHFTKVNNRIYLYSGSKGLVSIRWDGSDEKEHLSLTGIETYGSSDYFQEDHDAAFGWDSSGAASASVAAALPSNPDAWRENNKASRASEIEISPDGKTALAKINNDIYTVIVPKFGQTPKISLAKADAASFPAKKLTVFGGEFPVWGADSKQVYWSLGASFFTYNLADAKAYEEKLAADKKAKEAAKKLADAANKGSDSNDKSDKNEQEDATKDGLAATDSEDKKDSPKAFEAKELKVKVAFSKDLAKGNLLLQGARIITMNGEEVIENGDLLIKDHRIAAVGTSGTLTVPENTTLMNMSGKTITPGFIDTHAHMWPNWGVQKNQVWMYAANLAYGVTTTRDPQTGTTDVLTYSDMVDAGKIAGPRIYSTGPGVGYWSYKIQSLDHAKEVLKQYSEYYNTKSIKMYLVGNRQQRQWVIMAAKELKLIPTTEGGLDFKLNMTQLLDGYPGHEHSLPIYPIFPDVVKTIAEAKMAVTPTLLVSYGGPWAENFYYATEKVWEDEKLQFYTPYEELAQKSRRRPGWFMEEEHVFKKHAEFMNDLEAAGGIGGIGSHGQLQGLGYHWELWSVGSGGISAHGALKFATILGAKSLGLDTDLGSIEVGKIADLVILDANPLEDLRNTNTVSKVIKDGKMYDTKALDLEWPSEKKAPEYYWQTPLPEKLPGIK
jgi:Tol biopolymer transport system component